MYCKFCNCDIEHLDEFYMFDEENCCCQYCKEKAEIDYDKYKKENLVCSKCGFDCNGGYYVYTDGKNLYCEDCFEEFRDTYYDEVEAEADRKEYEHLCWYYDVGRHL